MCEFSELNADTDELLFTNALRLFQNFLAHVVHAVFLQAEAVEAVIAVDEFD